MSVLRTPHSTFSIWQTGENLQLLRHTNWHQKTLMPDVCSLKTSLDGKVVLASKLIVA